MTDPIASWPPRTILVPIDFSLHSDHALAYATDLARSVGGKVVVMHVGPPVPPIYSPLPEATAAQGAIWQDLLVQREAVIRKEMADAVALLGDDVVFEQLWREGEPAAAIAEGAADAGPRASGHLQLRRAALLARRVRRDQAAEPHGRRRWQPCARDSAPLPHVFHVDVAAEVER